MGIHEKAWDGLNILIFGRKALLPMELEQAIVRATPENEVRVDSFEHYEDALDHCKALKSVALIFIFEDCGELSAGQIFRNLAQPYEDTGWKAFGVLVAEKKESLSGHRIIKSDKRFIEYVSLEELQSDVEGCKDTLQNIWRNFCTTFENEILPERLQETLNYVVQQHLAPGALHFRLRILNLLENNLNLSWLDLFSVAWNFSIDRLLIRQPELLGANKVLTQISELSSAVELRDKQQLLLVIKAPGTLAARLNRVLEIMVDSYSSGTLENLLTDATAQVRPGSPALLRSISKNKNRILEIARECRSKHSRKIVA